MFVERQFRLARCWSNAELKRLASHFSGAVVNVSAGDDVDKQGSHYRDYFSEAAEYHLTNYCPGAFRGFQGRSNEHLLDLREDVPEHLRRRFDVALSHTVLEHVFDVRTAFRNTCELSRDIAIVVVPFAQVQHENDAYQDFWRFTPTCLRHLFQDNGMDVVYQSWNNNRDASVYLISVGSRQPEQWAGKLSPAHDMPLPADWIGNSGLSALVTRRAARRYVSMMKRGTGKLKQMLRPTAPVGKAA